MKFERVIKIIGSAGNCHHYIADDRQFLATELATYEISGMAQLDKQSITMLAGKEIDYQPEYSLPAVCVIPESREEPLYRFKDVHSINGIEVFCTDNDVIMVDGYYFRPFADDKQYTYTLATEYGHKIVIVREGVFFCGAILVRKHDYTADIVRIAELLKANEEREEREQEDD